MQLPRLETDGDRASRLIAAREGETREGGPSWRTGAACLLASKTGVGAHTMGGLSVGESGGQPTPEGFHG